MFRSDDLSQTQRHRTDKEVRKLIFVDTETTGLDPVTDQLVELSYAEEDGPIITLYFGVETVPESIDKLIGFTKRGISGLMSPQKYIDEFIAVTRGETMVAANPSFDKGFLDANGLFHFNYHMLDIESYAMAKLGLDYVPSMSVLHTILEEQGEFISAPDHSSFSDVKSMREMYWALKRRK